MSWIKQTLDSSIGGKLIVAVTGLALVGFIVGHLSGNLLVFAGRDAINAYAEGLRKFPALLWGMRLGLIAAAVLHIYFTVRLNIRNRASRPQPYVKKVYARASLQSRTMVLSGLLLLFYAIYHLAHFTWRVTDPTIGALGHYDVYEMLVYSFKSPVMSVSYIVAMVFVGMHLAHGISSLFQTLGLNHPKYNPLIRSAGPVLGVLLAAGYISIPVAILLGIVQ
jgi:succinate dehydrogenase / fumarate reductase cytochrome b subunit